MTNWLSLSPEIMHLLHEETSGQDLVEYAMVAALIALAAAAGMGYVAREINSTFSAVVRRFQSAGS